MDKKVLALTAAAAVVIGGSAFAVSRLRPSDSPVAAVPSSSGAGTVVSSVQQSITELAETVQNVVDTVTESTAAETTATQWQMSQYSPADDTTQRTTEPVTEVTAEESTTEAVTEEESTKKSGRTTKEKTTKASKTTTTAATPKSTARTSSGDLPKDMSIKGLYLLGYDSIGTKKYIYNDDKNAAQAKFGYNRFYDSAAGLLDFHIDTCRLAFKNYNGKDWMIQLWKGTYITGDIGTVGCEIGLYNRTAGKWGGTFDHYDCAKEADWLNMEMTLLWDDEYNGNYKAQFTRNYGTYWWPTGFVDGQLRNIKDTSCLRVLGRITFTDEDMAKLFEASLADVGFKKAGTFDPTVPDTYRRYVCDVIFCWQDVRD